LVYGLFSIGDLGVGGALILSPIMGGACAVALRKWIFRTFWT